MKKIFLAVLGLVVISVFLVGCAKEAQVGEAFRPVPKAQPKLIPQKIVPPIKFIPGSTSFCVNGYLKGIPNEEMNNPLPDICKSHIGGTMTIDDTPKTIVDAYTCVMGNPISGNPCPTGSSFISEYKNVAPQYVCQRDTPFVSAEVKCVNNYQLMDSIYHPIVSEATNSAQPNSCLSWKWIDEAKGACIPESTYPDSGPHGGICCTKKGWQFNCEPIFENEAEVFSAPFSVSPFAACGNSGAMMLGGAGEGYCCAYLG